MKKQTKKIISVIIILTLFIGLIIQCTNVNAVEESCEVNLTNLTYTLDGITTESIKKYTQAEFSDFETAFKGGTLPKIYITEFLYDGVGMVKTPDLDDFIDGASNDTKIKTLEITAININMTGNITFTGEITGGMIAVNTNGITGDINIILNNAKVDTDSKKAPAIYVYNKDINYTEHKVTIKTVSGTKNYLEGGKFKKVSLVGSDELANYTSYYSSTNKTNYETYTNYYGIYTKAEIENILFAKVQADSEDLQEGDPYYFYKGAGAVSSDIDLYFEGQGYLSVISKNKEGIETKGNLTFQGGTGDYYVLAQDDCLNTTTKSSNTNSRNALYINVNSLTAMVGTDADEGDCIDSNGTLTIDGGTIIAFAHPTSQDDGLDSGSGTYINKGTVVAIGNMSDEISNSSKQDFIKLNFTTRQDAETLVCITDTNNNPVIAFKSDRTFTTITLSSPNLSKQTYYVYKGGTIVGEETNGLYTSITSYTGGTQQQWSAEGNRMGGGMTPPDMNQNGNNFQGGMTPPDMNKNGNSNVSTEASTEFTLSSENHIFNNVTDSTGEITNNSVQTTSDTTNLLIIAGVLVIVLIILVIMLVIVLTKKKNKI